jgi:hypothetical protein
MEYKLYLTEVTVAGSEEWIPCGEHPTQDRQLAERRHEEWARGNPHLVFRIASFSRDEPSK